MRQVPEGWVRVRMQDLVSINPPRVRPELEDRTPLVFVPMPSVAEDFGGIDVSGRRSFASIKRGYTQFRPGDVLFAKITPCMENGKIAIVPEIRPPLGYGSTEFFVMRPRNAGLRRWIAYCVARSSFRQQARENMQGAVGQRRVPKVWLEDASVPLAPLPEQHRIVAKIESLFGRLDEGVAALKRADANLERYRASVLKSAVEGKLTEQWRKENPPEETGEDLLQRILAERRERWETEQLAKFAAKGRKPPKNWKMKYKEPVRPDTSGLPTLPKGWCWASFEALCEIQLGKMLSRTAREGTENRRPYLRNSNVRWFSIDQSDLKTMAFKESELGRYAVRRGDLLVCEGGEPGRCSVYQGPDALLMYQKALHRARPHLKDVSTDFLQYCIAHQVAHGIGMPRYSETTIRHLTLEKIKAVPLPVAPAVEQQRIARGAAEQLELLIKETEGTIEVAVQGAFRLRQSILKRAFEGRLVPQDPDDEPASVLLERIRAEREGARKKSKHHPMKSNLRLTSRVP